MKQSNFIKLLALSIVLVLAVLSPSIAKAADTSDSRTPVKTLLVYFSWGGNTETVANEIHRQLGCDVARIEPVNPYPDTYEEVRPIAYEELENGSREIKPMELDLEKYDTVIIGTPVWGGHMTPPAQLFLRSYNLSGKTIAPFTTHQGSGLGQSVSDIRAIYPDAEILTGLAINASRVSSCQSDVENWLRSIGFNDQSGISNIFSDSKNDQQVIYTLTGYRLTSITSPGIYIVNGAKKYVSATD